MTTGEILAKLREEREFGSRYPLRVIFVDNFSDYQQLVSRLRKCCDATLELGDFCRGKDTRPDFTVVWERLSSMAGKQVLLLSMGEYLRVCIKWEASESGGAFRGFWEKQQTESSRTRCVIPLFCARHIFERCVGTVDERQQDFLWNLEGKEQDENFSITAYSQAFLGKIPVDAENLPNWLKCWTEIFQKRSCGSLATKLCKYMETAHGVVTTRVITSPFACLQGMLEDGSRLHEDWASPDFWASLIPRVQTKAGMKTPFSELVAAELNMRQFDFVDAARKWESFNEMQRRLVWLWYRAYPDASYFCHACLRATDSEEIPAHVRDEILADTKWISEWADKRNEAVAAFFPNGLGDDYLERLNNLPRVEDKLRLLTGKTHEGKTFIVRMVSEFLRDGEEPEDVARMIHAKFPELAEYIVGKTNLDTEADEYLRWYRKSKLINRPPEGVPAGINLEKFDARYKLISEKKLKRAFNFWVDGLGAEYMPLLLWELSGQGLCVESKEIGAARLPTETEYNKQWDVADPLTEKWDRLDKMAHKGIPDDKSYYSCIVHQFQTIHEVAEEAKRLLQKHRYVIITGDHGSSRMVALAFHEFPATEPPRKSKVYSFGRFCELSESEESHTSLLPNVILCNRDGKSFWIMKGYEHFKVSGNVAGGNNDLNDVIGETHGGNTPEERLVPVIVLKNPVIPEVEPCTVHKSNVKKVGSKLTAILSFSREVGDVAVSAGMTNVDCEKLSATEWKIQMKAPFAATVVVSVAADGCLVDGHLELKIPKTGIGVNDGLGL